jgi:hypothetical protein
MLGTESWDFQIGTYTFGLWPAFQSTVAFSAMRSSRRRGPELRVPGVSSPIRTEPHFFGITSGWAVTQSRTRKSTRARARFAPRRITHVSKFGRCSNSPQSRHCPSGLLNRGRVARLSHRANVNQQPSLTVDPSFASDNALYRFQSRPPPKG